MLRHGQVKFSAGKERQINQTNEVVISSIILHRDKLADKGSKVNNIVENFCKEDETIKFMRQKPLDSKKHIGKDGIHLNNIGITRIGKNVIEFLNTVNISILVIQ